MSFLLVLSKDRALDEKRNFLMEEMCMTGLNFRHISYFYRKFGPVIYQTCTGWIRYPDAGHIENSIFRLVEPGV